MALMDDPLRDLDEQVEDLIYGSLPGRRFTQDSPIRIELGDSLGF
jgi:hypothetical protein